MYDQFPRTLLLLGQQMNLVKILNAYLVLTTSKEISQQVAASMLEVE